MTGTTIRLHGSIVMAFLVAFIALNVAAEGRKPRSSPVVIDLHTHTAGIGAGGSGCYVSPSLRGNWRFGAYLKAFGVTEEELEQYGDGLVIERLSEGVAESTQVDAAVVLALDGVVDPSGKLDYDATEIYIPNDFVARETARYENLYFGASINPYRSDALERLEEAALLGAVLVKWLPSVQHIDPADERLVPFFKKMRALGLPLLSHTGHEQSFTRARNELSDPQRLRLALEIGVTVIAAHAATTGTSDGEDNMERLLPMFAAYPNLYTDISSLTQINKLGYLAALLRREDLHPRLLYGTDMPLIKTALVSPWYFLFRIGPRRAFSLSREGNPWDRDVLLKRSMGVPEEVFTRASGILRLPED